MMDKACEQWKQIQEAIQPLDPLIKSYLEAITYDYMVTQIYAEFENEINKLLYKNLSSSNELTNNYLKYQKKLHRGLDISEISSVLRALKIIEKNEPLCPDSIADLHHKFMETRHKLTHTTHSERTTDLPIDQIISNTQEILTHLSELFTRYERH